MPKNILFRADSSSTIGTGHIMRDLVLAQQYQDSQIIFATQDLKGNINEKIDYKIVTLKSNALDELIEVVKEYEIDMVVIDHYEIDWEFEKQLKEKTGVKILSFDDTYERHCCDILLNHNISADKNKYKDLVPKECEIRCGAKYTLLRDEFKKQKNLKRVFMAMGGTDSANLNIKILEVLQEFDNIEAVVATTSANKNLDTLKEYVQDKKSIELHINSTEIAKLMRRSDFAVVTPSVTLNEVFYMGLDFVAIKVADNQDDMFEYLVKNSYLALEEFDTSLFKKSILEILS